MLRDESSAGAPTGTVVGTTSGTTGTGTGGTGHGGGGGTTSGTGTGTGQGGSGDDIPGGGTVLFTESFDDADFGNRGWYDSPGGTIDASAPVAGAGSFRCDFGVSDTVCSAGKPNRHKFAANETVYLSLYLKFSSNWVGSGKAYHPHMFHFINDLEDDYVGPSHTRLTTYTEVVNRRAMLALQDGVNVDTNCLLLNDDSFLGCSGDFQRYVFTEERSVCSCNGLMGYVDGRDCFDAGAGAWYSSRAWYSTIDAFADGTGPYDKTQWHFVEVYFAMNSIQGGIGQADGKIRWVQDGEVLISSDQILLRTGAHATLSFTQFAMLPYIGDGSPVAQSFWVDELTVATARP